MISRCIAAIACFALATTLPAQSAPDARIQRVREYLVAAGRLGHVNGSVLVAEQGRVLVDTAFGFANFELGVRNTPDTRFRVASITKQFAALAAMMLATEGKLSLTDPVTKWVDSLPAEWNAITIHHLLRHTSGISDYEEWFDGYDTQAYSDYMSQEHAPSRILRDAKAKPLDHVPGTKFRYSNSAYILLGYIIERASGMPFDRFLAERVHKPLGMTLSEQDRSEVLIANRAQGYRLRSGAMRLAFHNGLQATDFLNAVYQKMEPPQADAGLITTARDLYKWDQALYSERLLPKAALDSIFVPGLGNYGYGWFINRGADGVTHEHSGGLPGFTSYIMRIPATHRTIIVLGNVPYLGRTVRDIAAILRGEDVVPPRARQVVAVDSVRESGWSGLYRSTAGDSVRVTFENGSLVAQQAGKFRAQLLPEGDGGYYSPQLGGVTRFRVVNGRSEMVVADARGVELIRGTRVR